VTFRKNIRSWFLQQMEPIPDINYFVIKKSCAKNQFVKGLKEYDI